MENVAGGGLQSASVWGIMLQTQPMFYPRCDASLIALAIACLIHSLYVPESGMDLVHCNVLAPVGSGWSGTCKYT